MCTLWCIKFNNKLSRSICVILHHIHTSASCQIYFAWIVAISCVLKVSAVKFHLLLFAYCISSMAYTAVYRIIPRGLNQRSRYLWGTYPLDFFHLFSNSTYTSYVTSLKLSANIVVLEQSWKCVLRELIRACNWKPQKEWNKTDERARGKSSEFLATPLVLVNVYVYVQHAIY